MLTETSCVSEAEKEILGEGEGKPASEENFGAPRTRLKGRGLCTLLENTITRAHVKLRQAALVI